MYAQAYFHDGSNKYKRIFVYRNGNPILLTQPARFNSVTGTGYTGGVFRLQAGDVISVRVMAQNTGIHMDPAHTFFWSVHDLSISRAVLQHNARC